MRLREKAIEQALSTALGVPLHVAIARDAIAPHRLAPGETARSRRVADTPRYESWLRGRAALKRLLMVLGEDDDTSAITFPHRCLSLSHSGEYAVALATDSACQVGAGIDLELDREPHPESARFFLREREQAWLMRQEANDHSVQLLRLWTVKEALFKADPGNQGTGLLDYALEDPGEARGDAWVAGGRLLWMRYATLQLGPGALSVAIAYRKESYA